MLWAGHGDAVREKVSWDRRKARGTVGGKSHRALTWEKVQ